MLIWKRDLLKLCLRINKMLKHKVITIIQGKLEDMNILEDLLNDSWIVCSANSTRETITYILQKFVIEEKIETTISRGAISSSRISLENDVEKVLSP